MRADAIDWHIRLREGRAEDWEAFTRWLEQDQAHNAAYEAVALEDAALDEAFSATPIVQAPANDDEGVLPSARRARWTWGIGAVAALMLVTLLSRLMLAPSSSLYPVETAPGAMRVVALPDGSEVTLNGGTRILLDRKNVRYAALERGEARFRVVHDESNPFVVHAGDDQVLDVGTVFNMVRDAGGLIVEVSEGAVRFNPDRQAVDLTAGQTLRARNGSAAVQISRKAPELIGSWKTGRLSYHDETFATIAADLSRSLGIRVTASPDIASRRFTGAILIEQDREQLFRRISALLGVNATRGATGWQLSADDRAAR